MSERQSGGEYRFDSTPHHRESEHDTHAWIAFGVITGLGLINAFITFLGQDIAWAGCTIFLFIAILLGTDKPVQVVVSYSRCTFPDSRPRSDLFDAMSQMPLILTASLQVVALIASYIWRMYELKKYGSIRLPEDDEEEDGHPHRRR